MKEKKNGKTLAYELTKKIQTLARDNHSGELIWVAQREILKSLDVKCKVHLNPKNTNIFIDYNYLVKENTISEMVFKIQDPLILKSDFVYKVTHFIPEEKCRQKKNKPKKEKRKSTEKTPKTSSNTRSITQEDILNTPKKPKIHQIKQNESPTQNNFLDQSNPINIQMPMPIPFVWKENDSIFDNFDDLFLPSKDEEISFFNGSNYVPDSFEEFINSSTSFKSEDNSLSSPNHIQLQFNPNSEQYFNIQEDFSNLPNNSTPSELFPVHNGSNFSLTEPAIDLFEQDFCSNF